MKTYLLLLSSLFAINCTYASVSQLPQHKVEQEPLGEVKIHRVALGETMVMIAKKYMVLPKDIYELNPDAVEGLNAGMALRIPLDKKVKTETEEKNLDYVVVDAATLRKQKETKPEETTGADSDGVEKQITYAPVRQKHSDYKTEIEATTETISHSVKPGETLTGLARKYNTTIADITAANQKALRHGLQSGQTLVIPAAGDMAANDSGNTATAAAEGEAEFTGTHHVTSGETLIGLARKYNTTVAEIKAANERILRRGLQIGQTLVVPSGAAINEGDSSSAAVVPQAVIVPNHASYSDEPTATAEHKVVSGETLHGLARKYNTTVEAITAANRHKLKRGLQAGQLIRIPMAMALAENVNEQ